MANGEDGSGSGSGYEGMGMSQREEDLIVRDIMNETSMADDYDDDISISHAEQEQIQSLLKTGWRLTPATLAHKITQGRWIAAQHLLYISTIVATEIAKGGARIILTMPPRHGKSEFLSVNTPIWFLELWPYRHVMNISYGAELATDFSLKVRDTFQNPDLHTLLHTRLRRDKLRVDRFLTQDGGGVTAAGIGGALTGRGADLMLIDDYVKNAEAALSKAQKQGTWDWFQSTAYTRLEPNASLIILATRWGVDDLIGMCLAEMPDENWIVINLPAIAIANDPLGRKPGEALWPARYDVEALKRIKGALGSYWWAAMYQQDPKASMSGAELGAHLKIIREADLPHHSHLKFMRIWDVAATEGGGDYTAGIKLAYHKENGRVFVPDLKHFRKSSAKTEKLIRATAEADGLDCLIWMEQEPGSSGKTVIEHYATKVLREFIFNGEKASGRIEVRATPFLAGIEVGNVYAVEASWNKAMIDELNGFPDGDNDDIITAGALGYQKLVKDSFQGLVWGRGLGGRNKLHHKRTNTKRTRFGQSISKGLTWGRRTG